MVNQKEIGLEWNSTSSLTLEPDELNCGKDDGNNDYFCPSSFDENDKELYFDVSGKAD